MGLNCLGNDKQQHEVGWIKGQRAYVAAITVCNSKLDPVLQVKPDLIIIFYTAGGLTASGETQVFVEIEPSARVLVSGSAVQEFIYSVEFSGGGLIQGLALKTFNDTFEGEGGTFGGGTATVLLDAFTLDDFYQTNSNVIFDLTIDPDARAEFRKLPNEFLGVPDILYDANLDKFLPPTMIYNIPEGWKQQYKNIKLKVSYLANGVWVKNSENTVQGRSKGYGSFRPYSRQMPFKIKSSNFINGLDEVKDMTLNSMGQNQARLTEHLVYKIYNDYGMPAPRANYSRVFINDTTVKIKNIKNNIFKTEDRHYLPTNIKVKFVGLPNTSNDTTFYKKDTNTNEIISNDLINLTIGKDFKSRYFDGTQANGLYGLDLFLDYSNSNGINFVRNPNCWAYDIDLTCCSPWNNAQGSIHPGTLISPRHILCAKHADFYPPIGSTVRFVTKDNQTVSRTVTNVLPVGSADFVVGLLDSDVPPTITFAKILPDNWYGIFSKITQSFGDVFTPKVFTIFVNQDESAFLRDWIWNSESVITFFGYSDGVIPNELGTRSVRLYDSGSPLLLIVDKQPIILTTAHFTSSGDSIFYYKNAINQVMTQLGGGYTLTPMSLDHLTSTTFKICNTIGGSEISVSDFSPISQNQYIEFFTDFGEYINVENVHNEYRLTELFGANNTKHVYEVNVTTGPNELNALSTLAYDADYGNSNDRSDLSNFLNKLSSNDNWYQNIQTCMNLNQFIKFTAIESYCGNWDGYSWFLNNTHLHSDANGVFSIIPWGVDQTFSTEDILTNYMPYSRWIHQCWGHIETLLMFRDEVLNFHNWIQNESGILNYIDSIFSQKLQDFESDKKKPSYLTTQFLTDQKNNIKYFLSTNRCNNQINTFLQRPRCPTNVQSRFDGQVITITWNPVTEDLQGNILSTVSYAILVCQDADFRLANFGLLDSTTNTSYSFDFQNILEDYVIAFYIVPANNLLGFPSPACIAYPVYKSTGGAKLSGSSIVNSVSPGVIRITEVMSNSGSTGTGTADWFELTNVGGTAINITDWKMDDNSFSFSASVPIVRFNGWTTIEPGESVVCLESSNPNTDVPAFKTFWDLGSSVKIATYTGTGVSFGSTSDGVIIFNENQAEVTRVSFGSATTGTSFYWQYNIFGTLLSNGKNVNGQLGAYSVSKVFNGTLTTNVGSPGIFIA